jgi:hypothetical protein
MASVADSVKEDDRRELCAMTPGQRIERMLELGRRDLERFAAASGLSLEDAAERLRANRQKGRRYCSCFHKEPL